MVKKTLKDIFFLSPLETIEDIDKANIDVFVRLNEDDSLFCVEVATPASLSYLMQKEKSSYLSPMCPFIIVEKLTKEIIEEAIKAFVEEEEDAYWLKFYYLSSVITIEELNKILERNEKEQDDD